MRVRKLTIGWRTALAAGFGLIGAIVLVSHALAGGTSLTIGQITVLSGQDGQVRLEANGVTSAGLGAWQIDVDYDAGVITPVTCTPGPSGICNANFASGTVRVVGAHATGLTGTVVLGTLRFTCNREGSSALALTAIEFADSTEGAPQPIDVSVVHGSIHCLAPEPPPSNLHGDANCDGVVNSIDALIVLQYVAGLRSSVPCPDLADVDNNGRITAVDAALILQIDAGLIHV